MTENSNTEPARVPLGLWLTVMACVVVEFVGVVFSSRSFPPGEYVTITLMLPGMLIGVLHFFLLLNLWKRLPRIATGLAIVEMLVGVPYVAVYIMRLWRLR